MRIALVTESFHPAVDGTTTTVKALADRLVDTGHEVTLLAPGPGLSSCRDSRVVRSRHLDPTGSRVREALTDVRPDLVHVASPGPLGRKVLKHAHRLGVATVVVEQSAVLDQTADYWRTKVAGRADAVVVTSSWMVERASELGVRADLWTPGVDTAVFAPQLRDPWLHRSWSRARSRSGQLVVVGHLGGLGSKHDVRRLAELAATCWCTRVSTRPARTPWARRRRAAYPSWPPGRAARGTSYAIWRAACSTTRVTHAGCGAPSRRSPETDGVG